MTKKNFFNSIFVGITIFGTLVGAGFASGKEIWFYFFRFGNAGFLGAGLMCLLFFFCCNLFFSFGKKFHVTCVQDVTTKSFGKFSAVFEIFMVLSNLVMLSSMFAGADSLFEIVAPNFPYRLAGVLSALVSFFVVCFGFRGITKSNAVVVPILMLMIVLVLAFSLQGQTTFQTKNSGTNDFLLQLLYLVLFLGSNMFFAGFVFAKMGSTFEKKELLLGSFFGSLLLLFALVLILVLLGLNPNSNTSNMPIVEIALQKNLALGIFCLCVIWFGLLTTSFAMLYTISNWLKTYFGNAKLMTLLSSLVALFLSGIGFNLFIKIVYPILGVFGILLIIFVFRAKNKKSFKQKLKLKLKPKLKLKKKKVKI